MSQMDLSLDEVCRTVKKMTNYNSEAKKYAKSYNLDILNVTWEDSARYKNSCWGPCISDMTLQVKNYRMPVIRQPNFSDTTWDVEINKIPLIVGNENIDKTTKLKSISLDEYLKNFNNYISQNINDKINLLRSNNKDKHVIMSSQACFLPIVEGDETKFNVALYNYQSKKNNPAVLVIVSTSKGTSAQIIEGNEQKLLFNNNGYKADFIAQRLKDNRRERGVKLDGEMTKKEKQNNLILIIQIPLKKKQIPNYYSNNYYSNSFNNNSYNNYKIKTSLSMNKSYKMKKKSCYRDRSRGSYRGGSRRNSRVDLPKEDVENAIVKVCPKTVPMCKCNNELTKMKANCVYNGSGVCCDLCENNCDENDYIWHCNRNKIWQHRDGYDLCLKCGTNQLKYKELNNLNKIERDERYPIRVTMQYYKSTSNGVVSNNTMFSIASQLLNSKKQSDFCGSLVTEPNNGKRSTEWVKIQDFIDNNNNNVDDNKYFQISKILKKFNYENQYLNNFKEQEVNDDVLLLLSKDDLKETIPKQGPRILVWKEIVKYKKLMKEKDNMDVDWSEDLAF